mgnify:FL=1
MGSVSKLRDGLVSEKGENKMIGHSVRLQEEAIRREWREARDEGNLELAERIERANPDLFPAKGNAQDTKGE